MKKRAKYLLIFFVWVLLSNRGMSQTFLNGSFENNTANNCLYNINNSSFNSVMIDVKGIGALQKLDILYNPCSGIVQSEDGSYCTALENFPSTSDVTAISLSLSDSISLGNRFSFSFYCMRTTAFSSTPIEIGISNDSTTFGSLVFTSPAPDTTVWRKRIVSFIAPITGRYITARPAHIPPLLWDLIDNFSLDTINVGIDKLVNHSEINIFPNPSKNIFNLQLRNTTEKIKSVSVKDILGRDVFYSTNYPDQINLNEQPPGIYFLQALTNSEKIYTAKLVKE